MVFSLFHIPYRLWDGRVGSTSEVLSRERARKRVACFRKISVCVCVCVSRGGGRLVSVAGTS